MTRRIGEVYAAILGTWRTSGDVLAEDGSVDFAMHGTDVYEPLGDGGWMLHRVDVTMGGERVLASEVITEDRAAGTMRLLELGADGVLSEMALTMDDDETLRGVGGDIRFTMRFDGPDRIPVLWERRVGDAWIDWQRIELIRTS